MITIVYEVDCPTCDNGTAQNRVLDLTNPSEETGDIVIDVELSIGQSEFRCLNCDARAFIGDVIVEGEE